MERKNYPALGDPVGPYVHAVEHNGFLFLSGLTAFGSPAQKGSVSEQAEAIFSQIASIARAEQVGLDAIAKVTIFVTSLDDIVALRETLFRIYGTALPASSLVRVAGLFSPDLKIEVEAVLAVS
ncbi:RidA family protein [Sorangium sp. So ce726]|uniref:RidA family protein n=1 Tax=Sorangium sp. So ce726 TaxID=3133319 RepID=UPI003F6009B1